MKYTVTTVHDIPEDAVVKIITEYLEHLDEEQPRVLVVSNKDTRSFEDMAREYVARRNEIVR